MMPSAQTGLFTIETLGCKANQYDSQRLAEVLVERGWCEAADGESPDLVVVNTCTVTGRCSRKCRQTAARAARENPDARVFVTGCYASARPGDLRAVEGVEGVYGREDWADLLRHISGGRTPGGDVPEGDFGIRGFSGRARAMLKIQEGCDHFCSYCIVPHVRGRPRSRPPAQVRQEARRLADAGFREIVITGIHLGMYGADLVDGTDLAAAVEAVAEVPDVRRVRLSSIKADEVTDRLLLAMRRPAVCPHLHLPLQSGNDEVLRRMARGYTAADFLCTVENARRHLPNPAIATDVMVGFPGETEEQFRHTMEVCEKAAFSRMHVFRFSPRPGTRAASMKGRLHSRVKKDRSRRLTELAERLQRQWADSFLGGEVRVLFEERQDDLLCGYTDRYVRLSAAAPGEWQGRVARVRCTDSEGGNLRGELVESMARS